MTSQSPIRRHLPLLGLFVLAVAIVVGGLSTRCSRAEQLRDSAAQQSVRAVALVAPTPISAQTMELPGRIEAWSRAPIYARVSGYLKSWQVDIGQPVKAGQALAEIETPDLDQELLQARAELERARTDANLADITARRWQSLLNSNAVSRQEVEERTADQAAKRSAVNAAQANVERVQALQQFKHLEAPFTGIVTAPNTDVGSLINVGMTPGSELFVVSDVSRLRVYVNVPQRMVAGLQAGNRAQLRVPERPGKAYTATVQSLAQAIDAGSGTMRIQLSVDNAAGELLPGAYATVQFDAAQGQAALGLPPSALIIDKRGVQIATLDAEGKARLKQVTIARDLGNMVALAEGLAESDRVIDSPPDGIANGDALRVAEQQP